MDYVIDFWLIQGINTARIVFMNTITSDAGSDGDGIGKFADVGLAIALRVKQARGAMSQRQLAERMGVHFNTIGKIEKGQAPDVRQLLAIAEVTGCSPAWLLEGDAVPGTGTPAAQRIAKSLQAVELDGYLYVPHFDVSASAGDGFFNDIEQVVTMRPFDAGFIRGKLGIWHNELAMLNIVGRSYEPVLHSGDVALLDRRDCEALEGPHVIRLDGALLVKQLQRMPGRVLRVSSKNAEYEAFEIAPSEDAQRDFGVLGRLRWAGVVL